MKAAWFGPRTGRLTLAGRSAAEGEYYFDPPGDPAEGNDWVVVLSQD